jgi:hypothetical protein
VLPDVSTPSHNSFRAVQSKLPVDRRAGLGTTYRFPFLGTGHPPFCKQEMTKKSEMRAGQRLEPRGQLQGECH